MALRWYSNVIDCLDPAAQARQWERALDWQIVHESDDEIALVPGWLTMEHAVATPWIERSPGLVFVRVPVLADPEGNEFCVLSSRDM